MTPDIGDLCIVNASGCRLSPVAYHLVVVIAHGEGEDHGKRFTVRPVNRCQGLTRDRERLRSELTTLAEYGMRVAKLERTIAGFDMLTVEHDPSIEPTAAEPWGDPFKPANFAPHLDVTTAVDAEALPFHPRSATGTGGRVIWPRVH